MRWWKTNRRLCKENKLLAMQLNEAAKTIEEMYGDLESLRRFRRGETAVHVKPPRREFERG